MVPGLMRRRQLIQRTVAAVIVVVAIVRLRLLGGRRHERGPPLRGCPLRRRSRGALRLLQPLQRRLELWEGQFACRVFA